MLVAQPGIGLDLAAIDAVLRENLARYKQPKSLEIVAELPRNTMGKVQKNVLRERFGAGFSRDT